MKTTKKGFTLIELIVVIAIIGVLAAILVPTMLGYVRKSKISSINSSASSIYKAINSALTELDEEGIDVGGDLIVTYSGGTAGTWAVSEGEDTMLQLSDDDAITAFTRKVGNFFSDITKERSTMGALSGGSCIAVVTCENSTYTGTYPGGITTTDTYKATKPDDGPLVTEDLLNIAVGVAGGQKVVYNEDEDTISLSGTNKYENWRSAAED